MILYSLNSEAKRLVTPELVSGALQHWPQRAYMPFLREWEREIRLDELHHSLTELISNTDPFDPTIDLLAAPLIHQKLPLSLNEASEPGIWRYLTVIEWPQFVRHRWENRSWATMWTRFWSMGMSHVSNAIGRLWWIAELTRAEADYELTRRVLARQSLSISIFSRGMASYRPFIEASVDVLENASKEAIESTLQSFNKVLSTVVLESCSSDDIRFLLNRIIYTATEK